MNEYLWRCPTRNCKKSKLAGAIKGTVFNWVLINAASHLEGERKKREKRKQVNAKNELLVGTEVNE